MGNGDPFFHVTQAITELRNDLRDTRQDVGHLRDDLASTRETVARMQGEQQGQQKVEVHVGERTHRARELWVGKAAAAGTILGGVAVAIQAAAAFGVHV